MDLFGNLSYQKQKLAPIGSPVKELASLYDKKEKDYNYVVDNTMLLDNALSSMKYNPNDKAIVDKAREHFKKSIDGFNVDGDLENRVLDVKTLANDLNNKYGLSAVQEDYKARQSYVQGLKERYDKGEISRSDMNRAIGYSDFMNKGVSQGEDGYFTGSFSGRGVLNKVNFSEKVDDVLKGFESDKIILTNGAGQQIVKDPNGSGYMIAGTRESVDRGELVNAAKSYLNNDPDFQDRVEEESFYDLFNILTDPETGEQREMTAEDFRAVMGTKVTEQLAEQLNLDSLNNLSSEQLKSLYKSVKGEQLANDAIRLGVDKNSFEKYEAKYLKDWQLAESMKANASSAADDIAKDYSMLQTYDTVDRVSTDDYKSTVSIYENAKENLTNLKDQLEAANLSGDPDEAKRLQSKIDEQTYIVNQVDSRMQSAIENSPTLNNEIDNILNNLSGDVSVFKSTGYGMPVSNSSSNNIQGLNINRGELVTLINKEINGTLKEDDLSNYISSNDEDSFNSSRRSLSISNFKKAIKNAASKFEEALENEEVNYTEDFKWINLPEMDAKSRRNRPAAQLEYQAQQITKNANYYENLVPTKSKESLVNLLEKKYDVDDSDGEILWDQGELLPSLDSSRDFSTGEYKSTMMLKIPVLEGGDKDKRKTVQIPVHSTDNAYTQLYVDVLKDEKRRLDSKPTRTQNENQILDRINLNLFNQTNEGKNFDLLPFYNAKDGEILTTDITDKNHPLGEREAHIKVFKHGSPDGRRFYLVDGKGENAKFYAQDKYGNTTTMTAEELKSSRDFRGLGGNSPKDVKNKIANIAFNAQDYNVDIQETIDVSSYFGQDIKDDVNPRLEKASADAAMNLKDRFPGIFLTDALRPKDASYGAKESKHKDAKAIDLKLNEDARKIVNLTDDQKRRAGIKSAEVHDGNHVHIEFL